MNRAAAPPDHVPAHRGKPTARPDQTSQAEEMPDWGWPGRMSRGIRGFGVRGSRYRGVPLALPARAQVSGLRELAWPGVPGAQLGAADRPGRADPPNQIPPIDPAGELRV